MADPDDRSSIVIVKSFTYRDETRRWSNRYHFEGDTPEDHDAWTTLADNIVNAEKLCHSAGITIVQAIGYDADTASSSNPHGDSVFTKDYSTAGTYSPDSGVVRAPGDAAALLRWSTTARSSRNHPVYLMNYMHGVYRESGDADLVDDEQATLYDDYIGHWVSGFSDGSITRERCGPHGAVAISGRVDPYIRHRDFPS